MRVVQDYPPNYDEIAAAFGLEKGGPHRPIFAFGPLIYNPFCIKVGDVLKAHEAVHGARQGTDVLGWWRRYIDDSAFRYAEEIPAHAAEYLAALPRDGGSRLQRRHLLSFTAKRLASPLYQYDPKISGQAARLDLEAALSTVASVARAG